MVCKLIAAKTAGERTSTYNVQGTIQRVPCVDNSWNILVTQWNLLYFSDFNPAEEVNKGQGSNSIQHRASECGQDSHCCPVPRTQEPTLFWKQPGAQCLLFRCVSVYEGCSSSSTVCVFSALLILIRVTQLELIQSSPALQPFVHPKSQGFPSFPGSV